MVTALVLIQADVDSITEVANALIRLKGVTEVFSVAGNYDLVAIARVNENDELANLVSDGIRKVKGIAATQTLIAFRVFTPEELAVGLSLGIEG